MNIELNRLNSFSEWPPNPVINARDLARFGFFATPECYKIECNWCHIQIDNWVYGQSAYSRHMLESPNCTFLLNYNACGNVPFGPHPYIPSPAVDGLPAMKSDLLVEANRLATFKNWTNTNISPQSLAKAGFYYLNKSDYVQCPWCNGVIRNWEKGDNAFDEHKRFFPQCTRVQLGPLIEIASSGINNLGIQRHTPPKEPKYASLDARLRTYYKWPIGNIQRPLALAEAGLYYQDVNDQVRCFQCNIGLHAWEKDDEAWSEHAKWSPNCEFVRLVKGPKFVEEVQELYQRSGPDQTQTIPQTPELPEIQGTSDPPILSSSSLSTLAAVDDATGINTEAQTQQVSQIQQQATASSIPSNPNPMTIDEVMGTTPVLQALEIGIDAGAIRRVINGRIQNNLQPYQTVEELIHAVFDEQEDDDPSNSGAARPDTSEANILREVSRMFNNIFNGTEQEETGQSNTTPDPVVCKDETRKVLKDTSATRKNSNKVEKEPVVETKISNSPSKDDIKTDTVQNVTQSISLEEENRQLRDARTCKVCLDDEVGVVFLPCGHLVTCVQCAPVVQHCPMCRTDIRGFVRTFLS